MIVNRCKRDRFSAARRSRSAPHAHPVGSPARDMALPSAQPFASWSFLLSGLFLYGSAFMAGAVNFIVTIFRLRAPGMAISKIPLFNSTAR
jgi:hypothetical protein